MSIKRLQVLFEEKELRAYRQAAESQGLTMAEWVRSALRRAVRSEPLGGTERKLAAVREAARHGFPAPDVEQMNREIEQGYLAGTSG